MMIANPVGTPLGGGEGCRGCARILQGESEKAERTISDAVPKGEFA